MPIRMTGLASGLDTESIVEQLMTAHKMKKTKVDNKKIKLEWKQEKWKDLNQKLFKLYSDNTSKMRLQSSYRTKKVTSTNEKSLTATASANAPAGTNKVTVDKLASAQYVTSADISDKNVKRTTKLTDIAGISEGTVFTVKTGKGDKEVTKQLAVTKDTTVNDFVNTLSSAGLNASFDEKQGRFFISSKESGEANAFTITSTALTNEALQKRQAIKDAVNYDKLSAVDKSIVDDAFTKIASGNYKESYEATNKLLDIAEKNARQEVDSAALKYVTEVAKQHVLNDNVDSGDEKSLMTQIKEAAKEQISDDEIKASVKADYEKQVREDISKELDAYIANNNINIEDDSHREVLLNERLNDPDDGLNARVNKKIDDTANYEKDIEAAKTKKIDELVDIAVTNKANDFVKSDEGKAQIEYLKKNGLSQASVDDAVLQGLFKKEDTDKVTIDSSNEFKPVDVVVVSEKSKLNDAIAAYRNVGETTGAATGALSSLGLGEIDGSDVTATGNSMTVVAASDSQITLNGAVLKGTSNSFSANGITFNLTGVTAPGETITLNVSNDVDATYKMVKDFIKEYNSILKEMNTLYRASSARDYEPLTSEQKEEMSDDEIEKWETKIKDSLFRNDTILNKNITSMKSAMASTVSVDGKNYSLASFGIMTSSDYTEYGLLHIYGDEEDSVYSSQPDKLKAALLDDPDTVINVLSGVASKLYSTMADNMKTSSMSSALTFYNDKQMTKDLKQYTKDIASWEDKLADIEDKYYRQFTAMEKAMSKLNEQSSYLGGLFGTGN